MDRCGKTQLKVGEDLNYLIWRFKGSPVFAFVKQFIFLLPYQSWLTVNAMSI